MTGNIIDVGKVACTTIPMQITEIATMLYGTADVGLG